MLDFLLDNPFLLVLLVFWLFSTIFGKKKQQQSQGAAPAVQQPQQQKQKKRKQKNKGNTGGEPPSRKERYQELIEVLEFVDQATGGTGPAGRAREPVATPPAASDPYAFHVASGLESRSAPAASERGDYDTAIERGGGSGSSYEYRSPINEPEEQEYHLSGFHEFQTAHGLTEKDRAALSSTEPAPRPGESSSTLGALLSRPEELRRAFLLQEILGKPKALRPMGR